MMNKLALAGLDHLVVAVGIPPGLVQNNAFLLDGSGLTTFK